jgi:hypothetical protein
MRAITTVQLPMRTSSMQRLKFKLIELNKKKKRKKEKTGHVRLGIKYEFQKSFDNSQQLPQGAYAE